MLCNPTAPCSGCAISQTRDNRDSHFLHLTSCPEEIIVCAVLWQVSFLLRMKNWNCIFCDTHLQLQSKWASCTVRWWENLFDWLTDWPGFGSTVIVVVSQQFHIATSEWVIKFQILLVASFNKRFKTVTLTQTLKSLTISMCNCKVKE